MGGRQTDRPQHRAQHTVSSFVINEKRAALSVYLKIIGHRLVSLGKSLFPSSQPPTFRLQGWVTHQRQGAADRERFLRPGMGASWGDGEGERTVMERRVTARCGNVTCGWRPQQSPQDVQVTSDRSMDQSRGRALLWQRPPQQPQEHHFILAGSIN